MGSCVFTIVSRNYLHFARTLMQSVREHAPECSRFVLLCDRAPADEFAAEEFEVVGIDQLSLPSLPAFTFQYTILELNTAVKPWVFEYLFEQHGFEKIVYLDPDTWVTSSPSEIFSSLSEHQILLTPHLTDGLRDRGYPGELQILQSGSYNLGFLGLARSESASRMLAWWKEKLEVHCIRDIPRGLFVDQKWIDLVPGMFEGVHVERHPGWNLAYWNLPIRAVTRSGNGILVQGRELVFFHFSGIAPNGGTGVIFSKHQDRYELSSLPAVIRELTMEYLGRLRDNGAESVSTLPYAFGSFPDGSPIPEAARRVFRQLREQQGDGRELANVDPWCEEGFEAVLTALNSPHVEAGRDHAILSRFAVELYRGDGSLSEAFPDLWGADGSAYAAWLLSRGRTKLSLSSRLLEPIERRLRQRSSGSGAGGDEQKGHVATASARVVFLLALLARPLARLVLPKATRGNWHRWLLDHSGLGQALPEHVVGPLSVRQVGAAIMRGQPETPVIPPVPGTNDLPHEVGNSSPYPLSAPVSPGPVDPDANGINVVGYLHAESGVGQSARSCIRSAVAAGMEVTALDFRVGNDSRMEEEIPGAVAPWLSQRVNVFHVNADQFHMARRELPQLLFRGRYNIGYWHWELGQFPEEYLGAFECLDEVWTPSAFCQDAIGRRSPVPVVRIPHSVVPELPPGVSRSDLGLPQSGFLFLHVSDAFSVPERKNVIGTVRAFDRAFAGSRERPFMVLKISNLEQDPGFARDLAQALEEVEHVLLLDRYLSRPEIWTLVAASDCVVSLHRSEGFGLILLEAMALGKPTIATGWSGNLEFQSPWNSFLVDYRMITLDRDYGPYRAGQVWADPDLDHAAGLMNAVWSNPERSHDIGRRAATTARERFSPAVVGEQIRERVRAVLAR